MTAASVNSLTHDGTSTVQITVGLSSTKAVDGYRGMHAINDNSLH